MATLIILMATLMAPLIHLMATLIILIHLMATLIILIRYDFLSLDALSATWSVLEDGLPVSHEQPLAMPRVVAGGSSLLELRHTADAGAVSGAAVERLLELRFRRADGHEVIASDGP